MNPNVPPERARILTHDGGGLPTPAQHIAIFTHTVENAAARPYPTIVVYVGRISNGIISPRVLWSGAANGESDYMDAVLNLVIGFKKTGVVRDSTLRRLSALIRDVSNEGNS